MTSLVCATVPDPWFIGACYFSQILVLAEIHADQHDSTSTRQVEAYNEQHSDVDALQRDPQSQVSVCNDYDINTI